MAAAKAASRQAYAPYSHFHVGAALAFADGSVVTGSNVENASYGLTLCAETVAAARAMNEGRRGGLIAVAIVGGSAHSNTDAQVTVTPCGRCRQVLAELASLDAADPLVWCGGGEEVLELRLSALLPYSFGRDNLQG
ncbi:MAG: cytidine deaminase [Novosphingobium sp.]